MKKLIIFFGFYLMVLSTALAQGSSRPKIACPGGIWINSYTGSLFYQRVDISVPNGTMPLAAAFYYNSSYDTINYGFGNGWSLGYEMRIFVTDEGVEVDRGDGRRDVYKPVNDIFEPPTGVYDNLTYDGTRYSIKKPDGTVYVFKQNMVMSDDGMSSRADSCYRMERVTDRNNNSILLEYSNGRITGIRDRHNRVLQFQYNSGGLLSKLLVEILSTRREWNYAYDEEGNLTSVTSPMGNTVFYGYSRKGLINRFTNAAGNSTYITYSADGQAHRVRTALTDKSIRYEPAQSQTVVVDYLYSINNDDGNNQFTTYKWDTLGRVVEKQGNCCGYSSKLTYNEAGNVVRSEDAAGNVTTYTYDSEGHMLTMTDPLGFTESYTYTGQYSLLASVTERGGTQYTFTYDDRGNMTRVDGPDGIMMQCTYNIFGQELTRTDAMGNTVTHTYDDYGNLATVTNSIGKTMTYSYDPLGLLRAVISPLGNRTFYNYDNDNNLIIITDPYNVSTHYEYDPTGHITAIRSPRVTVQYAQDALGRLSTVTNYLGNTTHYTYDGKGNITSVTDAMGNTTHYEYDGSNNCTSVTDAMGNTTHYTYDALKHMTGVQTPDGRQTTYEYDARGQLVKISDNLGTLAHISYDAAGRRTRAMMAKGDNVTDAEDQVNENDYDVCTYTYDIRGRMTTMQTPSATFTYTYDRFGRCTSVTDNNGQQATYTYNNAGQLLTRNDSRGNTVSYTYDELGRMVAQTDPQGVSTQLSYDSRGHITSVSDTRGNSTQYSYDSRGRLEQTLYANGKTEQYTYDDRDNMVTYKNKAGINYRYAYDAGNRLVSITFPDNSTKQIAYDALGRTTSVTEHDMSVAMTYDAQGRILSETLLTPETAPVGMKTRYNYDDATRTFTATYPSGRSVSQHFDQRGRLTDISSAAYGESEEQTVVSYARQLLSRIQSINYGNGLTTGYGYDEKKRLSDIVVTDGTSQISALHYNYATNIDNILSQTDAVNPALSEFYQYDIMGRLVDHRVGVPDADNPAVASSQVSRLSTFAYDAIGNRTSNVEIRDNIMESNNSYTVNAVNAYTAIGGQTMQYDAAGNLTADGRHTYQYDYANRLVAVDNGATALYTYDPMGHRIRKVVGGNDVTDYYYSGGQVVETSRRVGEGETVITSYVNSPAVDDVIAAFRRTGSGSTATNESYFFHKNRQGSTVAVTDASGATVESYRYDAFGKPRFFNATGQEMSGSAIGNDILFTGREYDRETGFYYYRFRTMNPLTGRFIQNDPVKYADGLNMYAYAHNNPTNIVDPSGLAGCDGSCDIVPPRCMLWPWMCETERFSEFAADFGVSGGAGAFLGVGGNIQAKVGFTVRDVETPWGVMPWVDFYISEHVTAGGGVDVQASLALEVGWSGVTTMNTQSIL